MPTSFVTFRVQARALTYLLDAVKLEEKAQFGGTAPTTSWEKVAEAGSKALPSPSTHLQVAELLKYKMEKSVEAKVKRMPTVKKELSTQREILLASNETQVPKSLLPSEDPFNRLSGKTDYVERRSLEGNEVREA